MRIIARHSAATSWLWTHLHQLPQDDVLGVSLAGFTVVSGRLHQEWRLARVKVAGLQELLVLGGVVGVLQGALLGLRHHLVACKLALQVGLPGLWRGTWHSQALLGRCPAELWLLAV